ncbi:short-chain dehydrogenase [Neisseria chenwenguii]|uniref:Short-chain dehydrogenase n=1 Tax=Neisseria chenwenguii TaxID=1853278 RepID=A0A220S1Y3_9NEIS|nr:pirin family protein [Neisseria chenwenguii]ASK27376.1 short-chain dehydrogenase [Neisseria chenwenguii]
MRKIRCIYDAPRRYWVGNGFHVSPLFSHMAEDKQTNPFLMFDYAIPEEFAPNEGLPRGVGAHPHKGFETVTIAYHGEVQHRDSSGGGGVIKEGDVQWMTAGAGIVHDEFHSEAFSKRGGLFEMAQLWVNLPRAHKETPPRYQHLAAETIPVVALDNSAGSLRIIAGELDGVKGAAETFTEMNVWDVKLNPNGKTTLTLPSDHNLAFAVRRGNVTFNGERTVGATQLVTFETDAGEVVLRVDENGAELLLLSGVPINEPVAAHGPFVMNTREELVKAFEDFNAGKFGWLG